MKKNPITHVDIILDRHAGGFTWTATDDRKKYHSTQVFASEAAAKASGILWAQRRNKGFRKNPGKYRAYWDSKARVRARGGPVNVVLHLRSSRKAEAAGNYKRAMQHAKAALLAHDKTSGDLRDDVNRHRIIWRIGEIFDKLHKKNPKTAHKTATMYRHAAHEAAKNKQWLRAARLIDLAALRIKELGGKRPGTFLDRHLQELRQVSRDLRKFHAHGK